LPDIRPPAARSWPHLMPACPCREIVPGDQIPFMKQLLGPEVKSLSACRQLPDGYPFVNIKHLADHLG
jgi:hypothetical protein